jgi:hypothetical protein
MRGSHAIALPRSGIHRNNHAAPATATTPATVARNNERFVRVSRNAAAMTIGTVAYSATNTAPLAHDMQCSPPSPKGANYSIRNVPVQLPQTDHRASSAARGRLSE